MFSRKILKLNGNLIFLLVIEGLFAYLAWRTSKYSLVAALMPGIIIASILLVTTVLLVQELLRCKRQAGDDTVKKVQTVTTEKESAAVESVRKGERKRELEMIAWLVLLLVMVYLLGFLVAIPIFMVLFLRVRFSTRWLTTAAITAGMEVGVYLVFVVWLQATLYSGLLSKLFIP